MKEIETFKQLEKENPNLGSYILLTKLVSNSKYSEVIIEKLFNKLVNKDEYQRSDKPLLLKHLSKLSR